MAKQDKKEAVKKETTKKVELTKYKLKKDYPTSKGIKKAGTFIEASKQAAAILTNKNYI